MRALLGLIIVAALAWGGYWFALSRAHRAALGLWLEERRAAGWVAETGSISVRGFPNRIDTAVEGLVLADPATGWAVETGRLDILSLSYRPNHLIASLPQEIGISTPYERLRVLPERLRASVVFQPDTRLILDRSNAEGAGLQIATGDMEMARIETLAFATLPAEGLVDGHEIGLRIERIELAQGLLEGLGLGAILPQVVDTIRADIVADYDRPWGRAAIEGETPWLESLNIRDVSAQWGELDLRARGNLDIDPGGYPVGEITVRAKKWREMLRAAVAAGALDRSLAEALEQAFNVMALLSADREALEVPLSFGGGLVNLGPIPLGNAPKLTFSKP